MSQKMKDLPEGKVFAFPPSPIPVEIEKNVDRASLLFYVRDQPVCLSVCRSLQASMTLKEKIIHESLRQFSTKGFMSTSINDILEAVGTSKGGLYNHFKSKEENFPGGCIFVNLAVELNDQQPHLAREVNEGFERFKGMIKRLLDQEKAAGRLKEGIETGPVAELIFSGLVGTCVTYTSDKSRPHLERNIKAIIDYLTMIST
jgi:TetR/AcrR family transcriptional repressor of nem operon